MSAKQIHLKFLISKILFFGFIIIFTFSCSTNTSGDSDMKQLTRDEAKTAIFTKIKMANEKWASGDPLGFIECSAPEISWIDDLGAQIPVKGKDSLKTYLNGFVGKIPPHEHELSGFDFQFYDDIAIINYRYQGIVESKPMNPWKVTSVYRLIAGDWWSIHENWSLVMKNPQQ